MRVYSALRAKGLSTQLTRTEGRHPPHEKKHRFVLCPRFEKARPKSHRYIEKSRHQYDGFCLEFCNAFIQIFTNFYSDHSRLALLGISGLFLALFWHFFGTSYVHEDFFGAVLGIFWHLYFLFQSTRNATHRTL